MEKSQVLNRQAPLYRLEAAPGLDESLGNQVLRCARVTRQTASLLQ